MQLVIEYILCYSTAFGLGLVAGIGVGLFIQKELYDKR
jgi:hypothetical protein